MAEEKTEETKEEAVKVPEKFKSLVESVEKLSVLELSELVKILEKKFGVSAAAPMAVAAAPAAGAGEEAAEEQSSFTVQLTKVGDKKIEVIKAVRDATEKGLKEAKDVVDAAATEPQAVKEGVGKEEAEELKKKFEAAGATVELK
ncbi:50S ribosomal protein L7/L12 [Patescibacteria group bacterium]|nr:50S ribosomal protein L7/L12 [Patescibacteria group bacterium]